MANPSSSPTILIVGAGIFGTSTAYHLSLSHPEPSKVTVLDRTPFPPTHAASTDINKIVRADYTSPFYMELGFSALNAWRTWPILQRSNMFHNSGWIALNSKGSDADERIRKNFRERGEDPSKDVAVDESLRERWDGLLREADFELIDAGYENPDVAWADAGDAVAEMMKEAVGKGVKYEDGDVESLVLGETGIKGAKTKDGRLFEADKVLLATGAWTSLIMSPIEDELNISYDDRVEKQVTAAGVCAVHYKLSDPEYEGLKDMPVVIFGENGDMIPPPHSSRLLKFTNPRTFTNTITTSSGHKLSVPPDREQSMVSEKLKEETLEKTVRKIKPQYASRDVEYWRLCWDSVTPSQDQLITRHPHPRLSNLYLAVGGSFHSWKFLPTIGEFVLNVLNEVSNGKEKDERWKWKSGKVGGRGAHEKVVPKRELRDAEN